MKSTFYSVGRALRWSVTLSRKFIYVVPWFTLLAVVSSIFTQFFMLAGFLLPLKVILLLGSESVPSYFPSSFQVFGRDGLVLILSLASVCFYLAHLLTGKVVDFASDRACKTLLSRSKKLTIFENQQEIASKGYARYSQNLATIGFVSLCLLVLAWLYYEVAIVIVAYVMSCVILSCVVSAFSNSFYYKLSSDLGAVSKLLGSCGFLLSFSYIVLDHLLGSPSGILVSVVALLLTRQTFGRLAGFAKDIQGVYEQKAQLRALFFHGHTFSQEPASRNKGIWHLVDPIARDAWVEKVLVDILDTDAFKAEIEWLDIGLPDIICFYVDVTTGSARLQYVMKLFNNNRSAWAKHEATLLSSQSSLPTVPLIKLSLVEGVHCHVFEVTGLKQCGKKETTKQSDSFRMMLMSTKPDSSIISLYERSHPMLWQRIEKQSIIHMRYLLDKLANQEDIDCFLFKLNDMKEKLRCLPLAINTLDIRPGMMWKNTRGEHFLVNWTKWVVEPIGAKISVPFLSESEFFDSAKDVSSKRSDAKGVEPEQIKFSALMSEFETRLQRGRYVEADALISKILLHLNDG